MRWLARTGRNSRALQVTACCAALLALAAGMTSARAETARADVAADLADPGGKIMPMLERRLASTGTTEFWVRFEARADLSGASRIADWNERGAWVADALRRIAHQSQSGVRDRLDDAGVDYQAFWATNAIHVRQGSRELAAELAGRPEVDSLHPTRTYAVPDPADGTRAQEVNGVEWGIAAINADDAWAQYGVDGTGITVANIDTGVQYDHPALSSQYRGNLGNGAFDHNYNWFDAAGRCDGAPCDDGGHGTHTMGTMVGYDGGSNRIGVAPGVNWIAANGCCPSDATLVASGQWMLAPTDLAGENPDPSKRPHIINNSWGSEFPSTDPFMEDISKAWAAAGIFAVWSNGNSGPACRTSGSPGSLTANYSVGAFNASGEITLFSGRGPGEDGETKPNIAAPGENVRSSVPRNGYESFRGTSMAAPHVAGAVALLWSGAPTLVGEVDRTRALLDGSAADTPNDQCGGTDDDNNVFGEGRLDVLALLDTAPLGDTGTLTTTVTDASTGEPVPSARIVVAGPVNRERELGGSGTYSLPLPVGDYAVTVSAFGYPEQTANVSIVTGRTTTHNVKMRALRRVRVSGQVTDGSGHGWPLYAKITVKGMPGGTFHTRPASGGYGIRLPAGGTYSLIVEPVYGGYQAVTEEVTVGRRHVTHDLTVPVEPVSCTASGYQYAYDGLSTGFDDGMPNGWSVHDHNGNGHVWRFDDPFNEGNLTGGDGGFAIAESPGGDGGVLDSSLVTPVIDLRDHERPILRFRQALDGILAVGEVDLSVDGGLTWETVLRQEDDVDGPDEEVIPIPQAAGEPDARVRFHFFDNRFNGRYWQLDDVFVGTRSCVPAPGGLVLGQVRDRNTRQAVNGAEIVNVDNPTESTRSMATPDDRELADGFYWMFSTGAGRRSFTASVDSYSTHTRTATVEAGGATWRDFWLPAGRLSVKHDTMSVKVGLGKATKRTFTVTNTGSAPARVELSERKGTFEIHRADGTTMTEAQIAADDGAEVVRVEGDFSPLSAVHSGASTAGTGTDAASGRRPRPVTQPWTDLPDLPTHIMDNAVGEFDGRIYSVGGFDGTGIVARGFSYDPERSSWAPIADLPEAREAPTGAFIDGRFYLNGGWGPDSRQTRTTFIYDPATDTWSRGADGPRSAAAAGQAVLDGQLYLVGGCTNACGLRDVRRYDPASDSWEVLADYPVHTSHLACAGIDGRIYCAGGIRRGGVVWDSTYAYDPGSNTWTRKADLPIQLWGMAYTGASGRLLASGGITGGKRDLSDPTPTTAITNEGFSYEPETDTWVRLPASNHPTYRAGSTCGLYKIGGAIRIGWVPTMRAELLPTYGDCIPADVPWLSLSAREAILAPGDKLKVTVSIDADMALPGVYTAGVWIKEDTPYLVHPIDVTARVTAPKRR